MSNATADKERSSNGTFQITPEIKLQTVGTCAWINDFLLNKEESIKLSRLLNFNPNAPDLLTTNQQLRERVKELEGALMEIVDGPWDAVRIAKAALEGEGEG